MSFHFLLMLAIGLIAMALLVYICAQTWSQYRTMTQLKMARDALITEIKRYNSDHIV